MVLTTEAQQSEITNIVSPKTSIGYKMTELGFIPEDWHQVTLGDKTIKIGSGITPTGGERIYKQSGRPFLRSQNIGNGHLLLDAIAYIDEETHESFKSTEVKAKDVLLNITGASIGRCAVADERVQGGNVNQHVCIIRTNNNELDSDFLNYFLLSSAGKSQIDSFQAGGNREGLNFGQIRSFRLPCPSLKEQKTIAAALKDIDSLINGLNQLIVKKRNIKLATMQQLLTGKQRLSGFSGKWEMKRLEDVITHCSSGSTPSRNKPEFYKGNIRWITSGELNYNRIIDTQEKITKEALITANLKLIPPNTFLMAITGLEAEGTRGACGIVGRESTTNQSCMAIFTTHNLTVQFLFYYYVYRGKTLALQYCQGTKQQSYTAKIVKLLPILLPPKEEQAAITCILSDMDTELSTLEQQLDKARNLKQGMMQELLTGRIRLT